MNQYKQYRPNRGMPEAILHLLIINFLVYLVSYASPEIYDQLMGYYVRNTENFRPWQIITHMFAHGRGTTGGIFTQHGHILFNMFGLWMFGRILCMFWDTKRFLFFYLSCGLAAFVAHELFLAYEIEILGGPMNAAFLGASGAVYGVLTAVAYLFPNMQVMLLFPPIPLKMKWLVLGLLAFDLFMGFSGRQSGTAHFAHLGGALAGFLLVYYWQKNKKTFY